MTIRRLFMAAICKRSFTRKIIESCEQHNRMINRSRPPRRQRSGCAAARRISVRGDGQGGFRVFDVANVDNKNFSEKITTAPVSPLGQRFYVRRSTRLAVASPSTLARRPPAMHIPAENEEQPSRRCTGSLYVTDL